jgi:bifunctional UDP-N-acetylglucosamine pyrophosphorylase/glucosamine-1-phosphate N-acetyltransferase
MQIILLAAGQGKRMRSALPKVLQPLAGKPLLAHVLATARALAPGKICIVYGHGGEHVRAAFDTDDLLVWAEQTQQLGTGHAVQQAMPHVAEDQTVLVLYGDVPLITQATLERLLSAAGNDALALLTEFMVEPKGYGRIVRNQDGVVQRIVEEKDANDAERAITEVNTGILAAPVKSLTRWLAAITNNNAQGEYYLTDIVGLAVADGTRLVTVQPSAQWETVGVNDKLQLAALERTYQRIQANILLVQGVTLVDPSRIDIRGTLVCGQDVEIDVNCIFEGTVTLSDGVKVGANCILKNVAVGAGTRVQPFSSLDGAEVGGGCVIGPYARLRPGTSLANEVHIGNFVEVKNSLIGQGSKANHLSYLGDTDVGCKVNIGAGVITCNYDGVNKFRTVIEDEAFIGSDSQLVAPVVVGRGATIGAGTTLTKNAPPGQLTVSRPKQISVSSWLRPVKK